MTATFPILEILLNAQDFSSTKLYPQGVTYPQRCSRQSTMVINFNMKLVQNPDTLQCDSVLKFTRRV
jgi:hypothetical protein